LDRRALGLRRGLALPVAIAAVALIGCGGDDDEPATTTQSVTAPSEDDRLSKSEFIRQADAICQSYEEQGQDWEDRLTEWQMSATSDSDLDEGADLFREGADIAEDLYAEIEQLPPPPGDEEIIDRYLSLAQTTVSMLRSIADDAEAGDVEAIQTQSDELASTGSKAQGIARGYGFQECGEDD
jgi:hypothetical protein